MRGVGVGGVEGRGEKEIDKWSGFFLLPVFLALIFV